MKVDLALVPPAEGDAPKTDGVPKTDDVPKTDVEPAANEEKADPDHPEAKAADEVRGARCSICPLRPPPRPSALTCVPLSLQAPTLAPPVEGDAGAK